MASSPGSAESNPTDAPGLCHRGVTPEPLCAAPSLPPAGNNASACWSRLMPLAHARLKGTHMSTDSSHKGGLLGCPTPKASTGCHLGLNRESCMSSLAPCPESQHQWARQKIPVPKSRRSGKQIWSLETLLPSTLGTPLALPQAALAADSRASQTSEATVAPAATRNW